jgi:hypothetical protein
MLWWPKCLIKSKMLYRMGSLLRSDWPGFFDETSTTSSTSSGSSSWSSPSNSNSSSSCEWSSFSSRFSRLLRGNREVVSVLVLLLSEQHAWSQWDCSSIINLPLSAPVDDWLVTFPFSSDWDDDSVGTISLDSFSAKSNSSCSAFDNLHTSKKLVSWAALASIWKPFFTIAGWYSCRWFLFVNLIRRFIRTCLLASIRCTDKIWMKSHDHRSLNASSVELTIVIVIGRVRDRFRCSKQKIRNENLSQLVNVPFGSRHDSVKSKTGSTNSEKTSTEPCAIVKSNSSRSTWEHKWTEMDTDESVKSWMHSIDYLSSWLH